MSYVTGISGNVISAASAGWAPTNSAEVSAIASAYATGKQDTLSFGYDDDKISAINNSGLVDTAALHSADYSSLYVQEPLYISSSGESSYIGISGDIGGVDSATCSAIASAYVESGVSSKQDTLSFGYDDSKISAINGSALAGEAQIVTAVGTETAITPDGVGDIVTSINGYYISALSADSAFQATYDENGRELTSLASEYEASSIASSYAESAASSKQGTLTFGYDTASAISSIDGSALSESRAGVDLFVQLPLVTGISGSSAYIGYNGYNETTLYTSTGEPLSAGINLSESRLNFESLKIYAATDSTAAPVGVIEWPQIGANTGTDFRFSITSPYQFGSAGFSIMWNVFGTASDTHVQSDGALFWGKNALSTGAGESGTWTQGSNGKVPTVYKVIGVNRTAGI